jgi:hypothetical protein
VLLGAGSALAVVGAIVFAIGPPVGEQVAATQASAEPVDPLLVLAELGVPVTGINSAQQAVLETLSEQELTVVRDLRRRLRGEEAEVVAHEHKPEGPASE